ncbi:MAG: Fe-S cluster assembly ATPase SufC [Candidatus Shapirobacteria bacterium]
MLQIKKINVSVEGKPILSDINLELKTGEVVALMGPNGSGKSSLAYTLAGHPKYLVDKGKMFLDEKEITGLTPNERAILGLFLANQAPVAIPGLGIKSFLWQIYKKFESEKRMDLVKFRNWLDEEADKLQLKNGLLDRGLNDGFSGGERKKMEVLQMLVSKPKYIILDEIDSGLDVDALKIIALRVKRMVKDNKVGVLVITHYSRILKYLKADKVVIIEKGKVKEIGGMELVEKIEDKGFEEKK